MEESEIGRWKVLRRIQHKSSDVDSHEFAQLKILCLDSPEVQIKFFTQSSRKHSESISSDKMKKMEICKI